jgi:2,4-dienoyl-CoA reductase (NADPH2)
MGNDIGITSRWLVMQRLRKAGVRMETRVKATEITERGVRGEREGETEFFEGDTVVLAAGMKPDTTLSQQLEGKVPALYSIGDCVEAQRIAQAVEAGLRVAREI